MNACRPYAVALPLIACLSVQLNVLAQSPYGKPVYTYTIDEVLADKALAERATQFVPHDRTQQVWQLHFLIEKGQRNNEYMRRVIAKLKDLIALEEEAIRVKNDEISELKRQIRAEETKIESLVNEAKQINQKISELNSQL